MSASVLSASAGSFSYGRLEGRDDVDRPGNIVIIFYLKMSETNVKAASTVDAARSLSFRGERGHQPLFPATLKKQSMVDATFFSDSLKRNMTTILSQLITLTSVTQALSPNYVHEGRNMICTSLPKRADLLDCDGHQAVSLSTKASVQNTLPTMATPIKEHFLDDLDRPNKCAAKVQVALDDAGGCLVTLTSGPRKGEACGARIFFSPQEALCVCESRIRGHGGWAYDEPFAGTVFAVINADEGDAGEDAAMAARANEEDLCAKEAEKASASRMARAEAEILGVDAGEHGHLRPGGCAPEGKTWSFPFGDWVPVERLSKRRKIDVASGAAVAEPNAEGGATTGRGEAAARCRPREEHSVPVGKYVAEEGEVLLEVVEVNAGKETAEIPSVVKTLPVQAVE